MKHTIIPLLALYSIIRLFDYSIIPPASAAVPLRWTVETSSANPATFDEYAGATYDLEATLQSRGKPLAVSGDPKLYWQTNGMGSAWWTAPATVSGNVLRATWTPACDVGARVYNCFIGITGTVYNAAFQLRLRPSPGAVPNELPLPTPVIDFSKVTVINPPWPSGSARLLPRYLHYLEFDDTYPDDAAWYYAQPQDYGSCSAVRDGGLLSRNYDWHFDSSAEFVVRMSAGPAIEQSNNPNNRTIRHRFASIGVANCGTNLTESFVTSGKPSRYYKCLPGRVVDGINENGVVCEVNVVDGIPQWRSGVLTASDVHPLAAVRWALDNGTSAQMVATSLAAQIKFPSGWTQNFHWMVADAAETWIVENGVASNVTAVAAKRVMTNFPILPDTYDGMGKERYDILRGPSNITNAWYTKAYRRETNPPWVSEFSAAVLARTNEIFNAWAEHPKEYFRGKTNNGEPWWQTVHTSVYDITNRTLRICVQETDDWYTFAVPSAGGVKPEAVKEIVEPMIGDATNAVNVALTNRYTKSETDAKLSPIEAQIAALQDGKLDNNFGMITTSQDPDDALLRFAGGSSSVSITASGAATSDITLSGSDGTIELHVGNMGESPSIKKGGKEVATEEQLSGKRDLTDNTCHKTEFTEWTTASGTPYGRTLYKCFFENGEFAGWSTDPGWNGFEQYNECWFTYTPVPQEDATEIDIYHYDTIYSPTFEETLTRSAVCTSGEKFTTSDVVDGKVSAAVSTNNPAFVSAVRNTPTSGMPDDMPTDWGTYGTVGAALAALAAFVKWAKAKIVAVIGDDGEPTDTFATDLLGKQVAIKAVQDIIADDVTPATDPSLTKTIATIGGKSIKAPEGGGGGSSFSGHNLTIRFNGDTSYIGIIDIQVLKSDGSIVSSTSSSTQNYSDVFAVYIRVLGISNGAAYPGFVLIKTGDAYTTANRLGTSAMYWIVMTQDMDLTLRDWSTCLTGDTFVMMADGSERRIDAILVGDVVETVRPDGMHGTGKVIFTDRDEDWKFGEVYEEWTFAGNGKTRSVKTVHRHRFYNIERQAYVYMDEWKIGEHTYDIDGDALELVGHRKVDGKIRHYKITVEGDHNYFANGLLTGSRLTPAVSLHGKEG